MNDNLTYVTILAGYFVFGLLSGVFSADVVRSILLEDGAVIGSQEMIIDAGRAILFGLISYLLYRFAQKTNVGRRLNDQK